VNRLHYWYCSREAWKQHVREDLVPPALEGLELGSKTLEVGPGFGPATEVLAQRVPSLTALEIDPVLAGSLRDRLGERVEVVDGDGAAMPFEDATFSSAACFTMLHHVPSPGAQNRLFAEVQRVLRPGSPFTGTDSTGRGLGFALLHIGDTKVVIDPEGLGERLVAAGFVRAEVSAGRDAMRFRAYTGSGNDNSPAAISSSSRFSGGASGQAQREL
jgi:SAM-dependent methyltransferase